MMDPADSVVVKTKSMGGIVTRAYRRRPEFTSHVVTKARASTARSWLAIPNIGHTVRISPLHTRAAHPTVTNDVAISEPGSQLGRANGAYTWPSVSWNR